MCGPRGVAKGDFAVFVDRKVAGGIDVDARDLELRRQRLGPVDRLGGAGQPLGAGLGHVPERRDQAESLAAMLDAFADGVDVGIGGSHVVADHDPAIDLDPAGVGEFDVGADADRDHDQIGGNIAPVDQAHALDAAVAVNLLGLAVGEEGDAARIEVPAQKLAGRRVKLAIHQGRHQMDQRDRHAAALQPPGGFQAEQPAADHHGAALPGRGLDHGLHILNAAEGADPGKIESGDRRGDRFRAGGEEKLVVSDRLPRAGDEDFLSGIQRDRRVIDDQLDAVLFVPGARMGDDVAEILSPARTEDSRMRL